MYLGNKIQPPQLMEVKRSLQKCQQRLAQKSQAESYVISVVTTMLGGGMKLGSLATPLIRSSAVRGNLRFWWRATRGAEIEDVSELRSREAQIFGDPKRAGKVKIWVESFSGNDDDINVKSKQVRLSPYVLMSKGGVNGLEVPYTFRLHIRFQHTRFLSAADFLKLRKEIAAALWAWINFGGIGSRTRRGCGSLYCSDFSPPPGTADLERWYLNKLEEYELKLDMDHPEQEWPTLSREVRFQFPREASHKEVWKEAMNLYRCFRAAPKKEHPAASPTGFSYERSLWPEADSLRHITGMAESRHKLPKPANKTEFCAFPRAQLGLPMIFQFRQEQQLKIKNSDDREPYTLTLKPKHKNRLASPLIIKSLALSEEMGVGAFIRLNHPKLKQLELIMSEKEPEQLLPQAKQHRQAVNKLIRQSVILEEHIYKKLDYSGNPLGSRVDVVQAFLDSKGVSEWQKKC